jgi:glucosinolate gamma-glutamyl hydrolase
MIRVTTSYCRSILKYTLPSFSTKTLSLSHSLSLSKVCHHTRLLPLHTHSQYPVQQHNKHSHTSSTGTTTPGPGPVSQLLPDMTKFCILQAGPIPDSLESKHGTMAEMFQCMLQDKSVDEQWDVYNVYKNEFPSLDTIDQYKATIVTGSKYDAHDDSCEWNVALRAHIVALHKRQHRILGICYGHQITAYALGGKTGRSNKGWEIGVRTMKPTEHLVRIADYKELTAPFKMLETHQDQVSQIPDDAVLLASSDNCEYEMFQMPADNATVLCMQGHPEFSSTFVADILASRDIPEPARSHATESLKGHPDTGDDAVNPMRLINVLRAFIRK